MRLVLDIAIVLLVAAVVGIGSALLAVANAPLFDPLRIGAWTAWPDVGTINADPYAMASLALTPAFPLGASEGLAFTATTDDSGVPLTATCAYEIAGQTPPAQLWTITVYDARGALMSTRAGRVGFRSRDIIRRPDGSFAIDAATSVLPGNWLPLDPGGRFSFVLRLYDTSLTTAARPVEVTMPAITRMSCR